MKDEQFHKILELIADGSPLPECCAVVGVRVLDFKRAVKLDVEKQEILGEALEAMAEHMSASMLDMHSHLPPQLVSNRNKAIEKYLGWQIPEKFGDVRTHNHNITADSDALAEAITKAKARVLSNARSQEIEQRQVIDITPDFSERPSVNETDAARQTLGFSNAPAEFQDDFSADQLFTEAGGTPPHPPSTKRNAHLTSPMEKSAGGLKNVSVQKGMASRLQDDKATKQQRSGTSTD